MLYHFRLVRLGYGDLEQVRKMNAREVLQALDYERFCSQYETAYLELNK